ncbi:MAG: hypothetical protein ACJ8GW_20000 [Massilia sp.]
MTIALEMIRSVFFRLLLSLLLLVTQQSALVHAMTHGIDAGSQTAQVDGKSSSTKNNIHEAHCAQCLGFAALAVALTSAPYAIADLDGQAVHQRAALPASDCARTVCVFQSRAPPTIA